MKEINLAGVPINNKRVIVDADTIAYSAAIQTEIEEVTIEGETIYHSNFDAALEMAQRKIQRIKDMTGSENVELYFTGYSKDSFRYKLNPNYKSNRKKLRTPEGLHELKLKLLELYPGIMCNEYEADDLVVFLKKMYQDNVILAAVDKDVLNGVAGHHLNYYESEMYGKKMHWVDTTPEDAAFFPYYQCIIGDTSDGIKGVPGIGPARVTKFINPKMNEKELWEGVIRAYESKGLTAQDALATMYMVNMNTLKLEVVLWPQMKD